MAPFKILGTPQKKLTQRQTRAIAEKAGFTPTQAMQMAQIAHGESGFQPRVQQPDPGDGMVGYGLWQMTPNAWGAAGKEKMQQLGGLDAMANPAKNAKMAKYLFDQAGGTFKPWYGTKYLNPSLKEGSVESVAGSTRLPRLGGQSSNRSIAQTRTTTTPGVDNSSARAGYLLQYLQQRRQPGALLGLIQQIQGAPDVPASSTTSRVPGQGGGTRQNLAGSPAGASSAVGWAQSKLGKSETLGENRGPLPDKLNARFGFGATGAEPWCAMFTSAAIRHGGAPKDALSASVAEIRSKAQQKVGYRGFVNPTKAKAGDLILFGDAHIGMIQGRTKDGLVMIAGNDSDQVQQRTVGFDAGDVVRPAYKRKFKK